MVLDPAMPGTYVYDAEDRERFEQRRTVALRIRFTEDVDFRDDHDLSGVARWLARLHPDILRARRHGGPDVAVRPWRAVLSLWALDDGRFDRPIAYLGEIDVRPTVTTASGDSQDSIALAVRDDITPSNAREAWGRALVGDRVIEPR